MLILIDTNVILDYLISRKPFVDIANFSTSPIPAILPENFLQIMAP
jgi:predicted nucleic acid-binding protein